MVDRNCTIERLQNSLSIVKRWCRTDSLDDPIAGIQAVMEDALELLKEQEAVEAKTMGASKEHGSWWFACGACGHAIDLEDNYCRECGRAVKWDD